MRRILATAGAIALGLYVLACSIKFLACSVLLPWDVCWLQAVVPW